MMTNERKELKMMKVSEMRRINAGGLAVIGGFLLRCITVPISILWRPL